MSKEKDSENVPQILETSVESLKKEKSTDEKNIVDFEEDVKGNRDVKRLEDLNGIGPKTAMKLRDLGYTMMGLATARPDEVAAEMKVSTTIAKGWVMQAQDAALAKMRLVKAEDYDKEKKRNLLFFHTGSTDFNLLLAGNDEFARKAGGGIPTGSITGVTGRLSSGKTQIGFDIIVDCLGRHGKEAVFIETEPDTFHLDRLKEIASARKLNCDWSKLSVCPASQIPTAKAQFLQYKVVQKALENGRDIRLVVVDSMNAKFRAGWSRSEMLPIRTREFAEHFFIMEHLAATYDIAWFLTFQVIAPPRPDQCLGVRVKFVDQFYPVGGDLVLHSVNNWIALQQVKMELWQANLFDSSHVAKGECNFILTEKGLMNGLK